ncbi:MAG: hypothetical protein ABJA82_07750 [Myxococcales bacterium]
MPSLLGHEDKKTTQRYAKLRVDLFPAAAYSRVRVDFSQPDQENVHPLRSPKPIGSGLAAGNSQTETTDEVSSGKR